MGIQGLLPLLKECQTPTHIREFKGQTLAIDAYVWLHRGAYGCAQEIATGQQTTKYVKYAMHRIRLLKHYGITPYVVFDGGLLPSKMGTENDRESRRDEALAKAQALSREGQHALAREHFVKAVDITPQMAYQLIKVLKAENVAYVVAPYEADAQLAYLEKKGIVDGIITEDSDLLVFGCRKVLFKMDSEGACVEIKRDHFTKCREFSFSGWSDVEFRQMAILSGCDYLDNIQGLGIKKSHQLMRKYKTMDKVVKFLRLDGQYKVPLGYSEACRRAELTFMHQRVFCPEERKLVHLEPLPTHLVASSASLEEALRFVGPDMDDQTALGIALGELCPLSRAKMIDIAPRHDVLAQAPTSAAAQTGKTASIKDWFKPDPHASSSKKRPIKRESTPKPEPTSTTPLGPIAQVKSRFFVSAVAGPSTLRQTTAKVEVPRATAIEVDLTMQDDAESLSENEEIVQKACGHIDNVPSPRRAAVKATPPKVLILSPKRPSSSRQPLSESGFSHISSPATSSPGEKGKGKGRADIEDSGYGGDSMEMLGSPRPSPVKANSVQSRASNVVARGGQLEVEALDLTSPEAALQAKREPPQAVRIGSQSPVPQKRKRERSDTIAWTSDAIELSPEPEDRDDMYLVRTFTAAVAKPEAASKGKGRSPPPKRRNATIPKRKVLKQESKEDSGVSEKCSPEERAAQQSVINSWREKFSSSSSLTKISRSSSVVFSATASSRKILSASSRSASYRSFLDMSEEALKSDTAAPKKAERKASDEGDDALPSSADLLSSASELSEETTNSLESFRFRPSQAVRLS